MAQHLITKDEQGQLQLNHEAYKNLLIAAEDNRTRQYTKVPLVFISHRQADTEKASSIATAIEHAGVGKSYLATEDPLIEGDNQLLEWLIRTCIHRCDALLAVITNQTAGSWWVPFELGVAIDRDKHIAHYQPDGPIDKPPSYLWMRPGFQHRLEVISWVRHTNHKRDILSAFNTLPFYEQRRLSAVSEYIQKM